jgi:hypothetical protein
MDLLTAPGKERTIRTLFPKVPCSNGVWVIADEMLIVGKCSQKADAESALDGARIRLVAAKRLDAAKNEYSVEWPEAPRK